MTVLMLNAPFLWPHLRMKLIQKQCILLRKSERSIVTPIFFLRIMLQTPWANIVRNFKKFYDAKTFVVQYCIQNLKIGHRTK